MTQILHPKSPARLVVTVAEGQTREVPLSQKDILIGRDSSCDVVVENERKTISRKHAAIEPEGEHYIVRDLGSQNGVYVNGMRVSGSLRLTNGDEICLGLNQGFSEVRVRFWLAPEDDTGETDGSGEQRPYFVIRWPDGRLTTFELTSDRMLAGRSSDADLQFPPNLGFVSQRHFDLLHRDGRYWISDLQSTNGTRLNNRPLTPGNAVQLSDGDIVRIGDDRVGISLGLVFHDPVQKEATGFGWAPLDATVLVKQTAEITIGRGADNDLVLASMTISRQHARISGLGDRFTIEDLGSRNGTFVNGERVQKSELYDGDLIEIGEHLLLFQNGEITPYTSQGFRLDVVGLTKSFHRGREKIEILKGIDMTVLPKEFLAIVGASGAGKTTLMRALNGTSPGGGRVLINGHDFYHEYDLFRQQIGYVPQFEILHNSLTVDQALDYAARLRLPPEMTVEERKARIDRALNTVSMDAPRIRETRIANLSGGQRKRVSIAAELIADPRLIFLDEATSGLDPGLEKKMMYTLRRMADEGRTVILITHATSNIVQADHVAFLTQGRLVYYGESHNALDFFDVDEFADIYDRIERDGENWEAIFREKKPDAYRRHVLERQQSQRAIPVTEITPRRKTLADFFRQLMVLTDRALKVISSDWFTLVLLLLLFPLTATLQLVIATPHVITGDPAFLADPVAAARDLAEAYIPFPDMNTFVFVMGLEAVLVGLFVPSSELIRERSIYRRERMINLGIVPYLGSKVIVYTFFSFIQVFAYMLVLSIGVDYPEQGVFMPGVIEIFITLFLTMLAGNGLGFVISAVSRNNEVAIYLLTLMLFFQFFFAGAVFDLRDKPAEAFSYVTTTRWSLMALGSTIDIEGITESTVLCNTVDNPLTPEVDEVTRCFHYPEATDDLMLQYGEDELLLSWGVLVGTMLFGLTVTGVILKRMDTL